MKTSMRSLLRLVLLLVVSASLSAPVAARPLRVVCTLPDYGDFVRRIGGDRVEVRVIVEGNQDAHFIRPKPSFVSEVARADVLVATGLDLELWLPTVVDRSGNRRVRSGQPGYVAASRGMKLLEIPEAPSRVEGGVHVYGNPHVTSSPILMRQAAENVCLGLVKNDAAGEKDYRAGLARFLAELDERLFGAELVKLLGGDLLAELAEAGRLRSFLDEQRHEGRPLATRLGGWMGRLAPLRGRAIVTYHKNWVYFLRDFGMTEGGTVEPRPGIPPTPRHRMRLVRLMESRNMKLLLAANYFNQSLARHVAERAGGRALIVPLYVGGAPGTASYFDLVEFWVKAIETAARDLGWMEGGNRE